MATVNKFLDIEPVIDSVDNKLKDLEVKVNKKIKKTKNSTKRMINEEIEKIRENADGHFMEPIACCIIKRDGYWAVYVNGTLIDVCKFRFTARRTIKKEVKRIRLNLQTQYEYGKLVKESFYL